MKGRFGLLQLAVPLSPRLRKCFPVVSFRDTQERFALLEVESLWPGNSLVDLCADRLFVAVQVIKYSVNLDSKLL